MKLMSSDNYMYNMYMSDFSPLKTSRATFQTDFSRRYSGVKTRFGIVLQQSSHVTRILISSTSCWTQTID